MIIKNKLFLLIMVTTSVHAMDNQKRIELTVYVIATKEAHAIDSKILRENKDKCLSLGLKWTNDTNDLVEIRPRHYIKNTSFVNCLINNPRVLAQAISACKEKSQQEKIRLIMNPRLPKYIPSDAIPSINNSEIQKVQWSLYGCTLDINFIWQKDERKIPVWGIPQPISMADTTKLQKAYNRNIIYEVLNQKTKYVACLALGTLFCLYMI